MAADSPKSVYDDFYAGVRRDLRDMLYGIIGHYSEV